MSVEGLYVEEVCGDVPDTEGGYVCTLPAGHVCDHVYAVMCRGELPPYEPPPEYEAPELWGPER